MIGSFILMVGGVANKMFPLLFGLFLVNYYGESSYNSFLQLFVYSNIIISVSSISYTPLILQSNRDKCVTLCSQAIFFTGVVAFVGMLIYAVVHFPNDKVFKNWFSYSISLLFVGLYPIGLSFINISLAKLNSELNHYLAGIINASTIMTAYVLAITITYILDLGYYVNLLLISIIVFLIGLFIQHYFIGAFSIESGINHIRKSIPTKKNHLGLIAYSAFSMIAHYIFLHSINISNASSNVVVVGLGLQLFSIIIFFPGMLANIVIPRISKSNNSNTFHKLLFVYFVFSILIGCVFYLLLDHIFSAYSIEINNENKSIIVVMLASSVVSSVNALLAQYLVAGKKYMLLALSSLLLAVSIVILSILFSHNVYYMVLGLFFSYAFVLLMNAYSFYRLRYGL